ncbi:transcription antitermination protein NusB [Candidatus Nitrotoga sp. HW29]|uniref:transcription antitermination factor NusB n=1 Tax=Candidatus Nitrotoga sp. HW29 TaxID=2886963 RepID=UPI001EF34F67|nr:transcription antitermination factor NusB [Candidatus Nitrotoga sp. HW29]CAH1904462.1 transcription antitermination protein NusB [Candidatus Nitrotoga sp. HW29]
MSEPATKTKAPPKSSRRRSRELALQGIYQWRLTNDDHEQIEKQIRAEKGMGRYDAEFFSKLLRGVLTQHADIEAIVTTHLDRTLDELSPVELSVLLIGAYELIHHPEIPYRVVINEAVELAKTFGGTDGHKFVNGVLDKVAAQVRAVEIHGDSGEIIV